MSITQIKGTLFLDIDGTVLKAPTEEPCLNAVESINKLVDEGWLVFVTTLRGENWPENHKYSIQKTLATLNKVGLKYHRIIWDCPSPRCVINDNGAFAISHETNAPWDFNLIKGILDANNEKTLTDK